MHQFTSKLLSIRKKLLFDQITVAKTAQIVYVTLMVADIHEIMENNQQDIWAKLVARNDLLHSSDFLGIARALGSVYYSSCKLSEI